MSDFVNRGFQLSRLRPARRRGRTSRVLSTRSGLDLWEQRRALCLLVHKVLNLFWVTRKLMNGVAL